MDFLQIISLLMVAASGAGVVFTRDPFMQSMVASFFGLQLSIFFTVLQAPDVTLSEIVIGAVVLPLMVVLTVAKTSAKGAQ